MRIAISSMQFEKCAALRDKITQLKTKKENAGSTSVVWNEDKLESSIALVNQKINDAVSTMQFEKCVKYREAINQLNLCKTNFRGATNDNERKKILQEMNTIVTNLDKL